MNDNKLCFCSAAFGSWGIVRLGTLVPESKMLFVCPYSCGRHNSIGAIKHNYKDKVNYLFIDEKDIALNTMDEDIPAAVEDIIGECHPKVILIYFSCVLYMSGFDWDSMIDFLNRKYPDIEFRACMMNPVANAKTVPPVPNMINTLCSLMDFDSEKTNAVNLMGCYSPLAEECELADVLKECGVDELKHFRDYDKYQDYAAMGSSRLNIVVRPEGLYAATRIQDKIDYCFTPVSYSLDKVGEQYELIFSKLGKRADLSKYVEEAKKEIMETLELIGDKPISISSSAVCRPFDLGEALINYGFNVSDIFTDSCPDFERSSKEFLESTGKVSFHDIHDTAGVDNIGNIGTAEIAIGYSAGYYGSLNHVVDLMIDEGMFGYGGIIRLMKKLRTAAVTDSSVDQMIEDYGLII